MDSSKSSIRDGWACRGHEHVLVADPTRIVRIVDTTIIGLVAGEQVSSYYTSGVQPHKIEVVMREVEKADV